VDAWRRRLLFTGPEVSGVVRQFWAAMLLLVILFLVIISFYLNVESRLSGIHWTLIDAFYMAVLIATTIGFTEVHPLTQTGQLFTALFAIVGVGLLAWAVRSAVAVLVSEQFTAQFERRRRLRVLQSLRGHHIVCGYGRMGREAVSQLRRRGLRVAVIEQSPRALQGLARTNIPFVEGNATQDDVLRAAGIERAQGLIAAVGTDEDNLFVVLSARLLNPSLYIVARASQEDTVSKLTRAGANQVLSPFVVGGRALASAVAEPGVADFMEMVLHREDLDVEIAAIAVPPGSPAASRPLAESGARREQGAMILALMDEAGRIHTNPDPQSTPRAGDQLIAMGSRAQLEDLRRVVVAGAESRSG
jgi:voltage-gated potassium channel